MTHKLYFSLAPIVFTLLSMMFPANLTSEAHTASNKWAGYLIDITCARERKETEPDLGQKHTRKCLQMPACDRSGFGLLTDSNELLRFDETGNGKVRALVTKTNRKSNLRVIVQGIVENGILKIKHIELTPASHSR
jgi:hypothetical protein